MGMRANDRVHVTFPGNPMSPRAPRSVRGEMMGDGGWRIGSPTVDGPAISRRGGEFTALTTRGQAGLIAGDASLGTRPDDRNSHPVSRGAGVPLRCPMPWNGLRPIVVAGIGSTYAEG
jgi:hypothetical protein